MKRLAAEGIIEVIPQVGCIVRVPQPKEIQETFLIRAVLEGLAAEIAATQNVDTDIDTLESILKAAEEAAARTGVLGKAVVPLLVAAGQQVRALSRSENNVEILRRLGAEPVSANLFDVESLKQALASSAVVLHLATKIPPTSQLGRCSAWEQNDRIRSEGTRNLVTAATAVGVQTLIYPGVCLAYPDSGNTWIDASTTPVQSHVLHQSTLDAEAEVARFAEQGHRGIVLRMGSFYGPESPQTLEQLRYARMGIAAFPGPADAYLSQVWIQDAGSSVTAAALTQVSSGIYDIVDDEPLTRSELFKAMAQSIGRRRLLHLPGPLMRLMTGVAADMLNRSQRVSNRRFKELTGWQPSVSDARAGWKLIAETTTTSGTPRETAPTSRA